MEKVHSVEPRQYPTSFGRGIEVLSYQDPVSYLTHALFIFEQQLGPNHPHIAFTLYNLANLYRDQGKDQQTESLYQRALAICEQCLGPDHPRTMKLRNDRSREETFEGMEKR
jgi:tetratricopeptide (TPR) repeat protein